VRRFDDPAPATTDDRLQSFTINRSSSLCFVFYRLTMALNALASQLVDCILSTEDIECGLSEDAIKLQEMVKTPLLKVQAIALGSTSLAARSR